MVPVIRHTQRRVTVNYSNVRWILLPIRNPLTSAAPAPYFTRTKRVSGSERSRTLAASLLNIIALSSHIIMWQKIIILEPTDHHYLAR